MDDDGSKGLDFDEFKKGVHDCGLSFTKEVNKSDLLFIINLSDSLSICPFIHLSIRPLFVYPSNCLCIHSYLFLHNSN